MHMQPLLRWRHAGVAVLAIVLALFLSSPVHAGGPAFDVNTTADDPTLIMCGDPSPGPCSLRGAVDVANSSPSVNTINLQQGMTYTLTKHGQGEDNNITGDIDILEPVIIEGHGATVNGDAADRVFDVFPNMNTGTVDIGNVSITNGKFTFGGDGGGIRVNAGTLHADHLTITNNIAQSFGGGIGFAQNTSGDLSHLMVTGNTAATVATISGGGIYFPGGTGSLVISDSDFANNTAGVGGGVDVSGEVTITNSDFSGNHAHDSSNAYGGGVTMFGVPGQVSSISGGTITGNDALDQGGGLYVQGGVYVSNVTVSNNTAHDAGGVYSVDDGTVLDHLTIAGNTAVSVGGLGLVGTLTDSVVSGNTASTIAGGILAGFSAQIDHSLITDNTAGTDGGGIWADGQTTVITNTTITGNTADRGAGIFKPFLSPDSVGGVTPQGAGQSDVTVTFTTISANDGGNIFGEAGTSDMKVKASIIANPINGSNCSGALQSQGYNIADDSSCDLTGTGDLENADTKLNPLANNGGDSPTVSLQAGSAAIDAVTAGCPPPSDDQRHSPRPKGTQCDAGAFESSFSATPSPTPAVSQRIWGDSDCDGSVNPLDALAIATKRVGLEAPPQDGCMLGEGVTVNGVQRPWGDFDCNGLMDGADITFILAFNAGVPRDPLTVDCPAMEQQVTVPS